MTKQQEANQRQAKIAKQWQGIYQNYPQAINDLFRFIDDQREMLRGFAEERAIGDIAINNDIIAGLLQQSRGCNIVKTYIKGLIDPQDVAQPIKKPK